MNITSDKLEENVTLIQAEQEYKEAIDIFPALHKIKQSTIQSICKSVKALYLNS